MAVLSFYAEVIDEALPERDPQDDGVPAAGECAGADQRSEAGKCAAPIGPWMALTYFSLWMTRLMGLLPDIAHCMVCGEALERGRSALQRLCRRIVLRAAREWHRRAGFRPIAGNWRSACCGRRRRLLPTNFGRGARAGSKAVYAADAGAAFGTEAEEAEALARLGG